ncbi:MAG: lipopolysaccharide biosynthesis protein, partial [Rhodanobacter sp.]
TRHPEIAAHIRREGLLFFVLQLAAALAFSADLPLISALRSPTDAGGYAIVQRLFSIIPLGLAFIWAPLWPIYRQALATGDHRWIVRTLRRSVLMAVVFASIAGAVLALGFERIAGLWINRPLMVSGMLLAGFATWCAIDAAGTAIATFLNAASIMRYQVIIATIFAITCVALKIWAIVHVGVWIVPWVTAVAFLVVNLLPTVVLGPRIMALTRAKTY